MLLAISHAENATTIVVNEYIKENVWRAKLFSIIKKNTNLPIQIVFNQPKMVGSASDLAMQQSAYQQLINIKDFLATHFPKANIQLVGIVNNDIKQYFIQIVLTEE